MLTSFDCSVFRTRLPPGHWFFAWWPRQNRWVTRSVYVNSQRVLWVYEVMDTDFTFNEALTRARFCGLSFGRRQPKLYSSWHGKDYPGFNRSRFRLGLKDVGWQALKHAHEQPAHKHMLSLIVPKHQIHPDPMSGQFSHLARRWISNLVTDSFFPWIWHALNMEAFRSLLPLAVLKSLSKARSRNIKSYEYEAIQVSSASSAAIK